MSTFIVIHGVHTSTRTPLEYVEHIVYGEPRIEAVLVGSHFVALVEYPEGEESTANHTFNRLGSFGSLGAQLMLDRLIALREFGVWVHHWAPGTFGAVKPV